VGTALRIGLGVVAGILLLWLALVAVLLAVRPRGSAVREAVRLLPDLLRLVARLAADRSLPTGVRLKLGLLTGYLAMPVDLVPDFVPVLGYADDAIAVAWTLRSVTRQVGLPAVRRHWPGTDTGFAALTRLCGLDRPAPTRPRLSWWPDLLLVAGFVSLTGALARRWLLSLDLAVRDACDDWVQRYPPTHPVARVLSTVGQGTVLTVIALGLALLLVRRTRSWRPLAPVAAAFALTYVTLGPLKLWLDRAAPHAKVPHPERLFSGGLSYPSGHAVNTVVWYFVLVVLLEALLPNGLPARWRAVARVAPPVVVTLTSTYVGYHWVTDMAAGFLVGVLIERFMRRVPWLSEVTRP
jgi:uncharacterized membrane protein YkvA (DUF1232 family)/membrane-associated phospholipid phosphatase